MISETIICDLCRQKIPESDISKFYYKSYVNKITEAQYCKNCRDELENNYIKIDDFCKTHKLCRLEKAEITHKDYAHTGYKLYLKDLAGKEYTLNICFQRDVRVSQKSLYQFYKYIEYLTYRNLKPEDVITRITYNNYVCNFEYIEIANYEFTKKYVQELIQRAAEEVNLPIDRIKNIIKDIDD